MIWITWRQQRLETLIGVAVLALVAIFLLHTGLDIWSSYQHNGLSTCVAQHFQQDSCWSIRSAFQGQYGSLTGVVGWLNFLPLILGITLGAPFVLELEQGTHRLAWTQSITRSRWTAIKLGLIVASALLVALALIALMSWWRGPFDHLQGRFDPTAFDFEGTVPIGYTVFAVALVISVGTLLRRTIPTMAIALPAFLAIRLTIENLVRPHYMAPVVQTGPAGTLGGDRSLDWIVQSDWRDHLGHTLDNPWQLCTPGADKTTVFSCLRAHGVLDYLAYQPANRFWTFQAIETAIFLGLAGAMLALTVWWVRYRIA